MNTRRVLILGIAVVAMAAIVVGRTYRQFYGSRYTSPPADATAVIAGDHLRIDYYAPSMHGRKIMGGLVPFGQVWATGANWATKITTDNDLKIGDLNVPKGAYSLWTVPGEKEWTLIVNKEARVFHLYYDESQDFGRTKMSVKALSDPVETLHIELRPNGGNQGILAVQWEKTEASVPFTVKQ